MTANVRNLGWAGLGAGLMFLLDPARGRRRRTFVRDKVVRSGNVLGRELDKAARDLRNRTTGVASEARRAVESAFTGEHADDAVLVARVRTKIGRFVRHPHAIHVTAYCGVVTLSGDVLADEVERLVGAVRSVPGVVDVDSRLIAHSGSHGISSLQGEGRLPGPRLEWMQSKWTPGLRVLAAAGGGALAAIGASRGGVTGAVAGFTGAALLTRATANRTLDSVVGWKADPDIEIQKTVSIAAPLDEVFVYLTTLTNLPRFMSHLRDVRDLGSARYHWVVDGPGGLPVAWDGEITRLEKGRLLEWRSLPGSVIVNRGAMRFEENPDGGTRVTVRMLYRPPAGMIGHAVAALFGVDPKHEMDDDFVRLKSLLENGVTRAHGHAVTPETVFAGVGEP